jgi:septum formation protein
VLGVDTEVFLDGRLFGKPAGEADARTYLESLSGRTHEVFSGLALIRGGDERTGTARTQVTFRALDAPLVDWYLRSGEWRGRAGGYAVQGRGAALIASIDGDYWNVVGLPVALLLDIAPWVLSE